MDETSVFTLGDTSVAEGGDTCARKSENVARPAPRENTVAATFARTLGAFFQIVLRKSTTILLFTYIYVGVCLTSTRGQQTVFFASPRRLDLGDPLLLSPCGETASLDRYLKGPGNPFRRLFSFFHDVFPTRCASPTRLEQPRGGCADRPETGLAQSVRTRVPRRRRVHHLERLDADAIDNATRRSGSCRVGRVVSRAVPA